MTTGSGSGSCGNGQGSRHRPPGCCRTLDVAGGRGRGRLQFPSSTGAGLATEIATTASGWVRAARPPLDRGPHAAGHFSSQRVLAKQASRRLGKSLPLPGSPSAVPIGAALDGQARLKELPDMTSTPPPSEVPRQSDVDAFGITHTGRSGRQTPTSSHPHAAQDDARSGQQPSPGWRSQTSDARAFISGGRRRRKWREVHASERRSGST
jgi:hypothetical protein